VKRRITQLVALGEHELLALSDDGLLFRANGDLSDLSWETLTGLPDAGEEKEKELPEE
jgi:hypothetical protein